MSQGRAGRFLECRRKRGRAPDHGSRPGRRTARCEHQLGEPALCQAEHDETIAQVTGLAPKRVFAASWLIYHVAGKDPDAAPASETNQILDAINALFPTGDPDHVQTLNDLVHHAFISGKVFTDSGDLDGQALIIVPIQMLAP